MSRRVTILFFAVVAAQVIGLVVFAGMRQVAVTQDRVVTLQTVPVDPRSLLQGDYAILDYEIAELPTRLQSEPPGTTVYAVLEECGAVWCALTHINYAPGPPQVFIRGTIDHRGRIDFGIGTFFVPEGTGYLVERAADVKVEVSLDDSGRGVIKTVLIDGEPFDPEAAEPADPSG